jgi:hypothetical protein
MGCDARFIDKALTWLRRRQLDDCRCRKNPNERSAQHGDYDSESASHRSTGSL